MASTNGDHLLDVANRAEWRRWLAKNHAREKIVWLVAWKVGSGKRTLTYDDAVEEALCFGWIDSTVHAIDERRFARKFTPRTNPRMWSEPNLKRFAKMQAAGLVTGAGLRVYAPIPCEDPLANAKAKPGMPRDFRLALKQNAKACEFFSGLAPSYRNQFIEWICAAKKPETRARRIAGAVQSLSRGLKFGMK